MKIIHVINYFQPKLGYQETFLPREQIKMGHDVAVITSDRYYPFAHFKESYGALLGNRKCKAGYREEEGIPTYRLQSFFEIKYRVWLQGLEKLIVKLKPDLVISHGLLSSSFRIARLRAKGYKFKLIVDDHMLEIVTRQDAIGRLYYNRRKVGIQKVLVPWVDKFVGVTQETCQMLAGRNGIPKEKIEYIPLGSDTELFKFNEGERKETRAKLGISDNDILLLYTGKINRNKGVDVLVKAFDLLSIDRMLYLLLVGNGAPEFKNALINTVKEKKKANIVFQPFVPTTDLPKFYNAADICVWAKESSTSILDAMACERPVIGCDIPAVKERFANDNGITYTMGDDRDLAAKIKYLSENEQLRQIMGSKGRELVKKQFSWKIIGKKFIECAGE